MTTDPHINEADQRLAAFADGELDGEQNLEVLKQMAEDPSIAERVNDHQKLRVAVSKAMNDPALKTPDALRQKITQMADAELAKPAQRTSSPVLARIGRWAPAAVAAVLLLGAVIALNQPGGQTNQGLITSANVLNASLVDQFEDRHTKCARHITPMHGTDKFPQDLDALPGALSTYFDQPIDEDALDLTALGFRFDMAGLCILPGKGSVHIVYQSKTDDGRLDTMSLWLRPFEDGSGIEPDRLYKTADPLEQCPMLVWRAGDMVYYLVGDSHDAVERAFDAISQNQG